MPARKGDLIKGQSSLAHFFAGAELVAAKPEAPTKQQATGEDADADAKRLRQTPSLSKGRPGAPVSASHVKDCRSKTPPTDSPAGGRSSGRARGGGAGSRSGKKQQQRAAAASSSVDSPAVAPQQHVTELADKITIAGYKASPAASPANRRTYTGESDEEEAIAASLRRRRSHSEQTPEADGHKMTSSKYFPSSSKGSSSKRNDAIAISDSSSEDDDKPRTAARKVNGSGNGGAKRKTPPAAHAPSKSPKRGKEAVGPSHASSTRTSPRHANKVKGGAYDDEDFGDDDDEEEEEDDPFEPDEDDLKPSKGSAKAAPRSASSSSKTSAKPLLKAQKEKDDMEVDEKPAEKEKPKFNWAAAAKRKEAGPAMPGSKEIPVGKPNCLAGITFVFTGELSSIGREEAQNLAKRYGAKVTGAPSSKTNFVVVGENAGPSKLEKIKNYRLATLDEDGFLNLIKEKSQGPIKLDDATKKKMAEEQKKIEKAAGEIGPVKGAPVFDNALWTTKYAPADTKSLVGNGPAVAKLQNWLHDWSKNLNSNFKKPGKDASGTFRAVLLSGPPGIGKTSAAHVISKLEGFSPIELNASDVRSKKLIEASLKETINNTSLDGWYKGGKINKNLSVDGMNLTDRTVLIMDEVDGMAGGDRGGVGAINALIKKTKVPIICICNDAKSPKMGPLTHTAFQIKFAKPDARHVKTRIMTIAFKEKLRIPGEVVEQLIQAAQSDIRLIINMLSTWSLNKKSMDFDEGKEFGAANAKPGMHTPFSLYAALSSPGMWAPTNKKTLNDKADFYFQDHAFMPLMVQQNYINQTPPKANRLTGKERDVCLLQEITKAASSISDGDIVDSMIHSSEQHWSLMPLHGIISTVKPMQFAHGGAGSFPSFTSWLGSNSKQQRLTRAAVELQARMRLVTTASRFEVRQQYLPYFFPKLIRPMLNPGKGGNAEGAVEDIIEFMDEYYLTIEDRDIILELGMGENDFEVLGKKIPSATKSAFTRKYNAATHPIAFYKGTDIGAKAKKLTGDPAPDVEEAYEKEEEPPADDDSDAGGKDASAGSDDEVDLSKDKFFKQKNAKGKGKSAAAKKK